MSKKSVTKGKSFERQIAREISEVIGVKVQRGFQYRKGQEAPDVDMPRFWVECKRMKKTNPKQALKQACEDSDGRAPLVVCKDDFEHAIITMRWSDFKIILEQVFRIEMVE